MKNEIIKFESPELAAIEPSKAAQIKAVFEPMAKMLEEFESQYNEVVNASENGITGELTAKAKRLRIDIGRVRIAAEKVRKDQKEEYLRAGKAIDGVSNILKWAVTDRENRLKEIEDYYEIQEQKRLETLQAERADQLSPYLEDAHERDLSSMPDDVWAAYFDTKKREYEDRIAAEIKAEKERIAKEKAEAAEQERIRKENIRLQKAAAAERVKVEAERKAAEEKARKEREAYEAKIKAEREAREKIEAKIKAEKEAAEAERKAKEEAERKAKAAPDKEKLLAFAEMIDDMQLPELATDQAREISEHVSQLLTKVSTYIRQKANEL